MSVTIKSKSKEVVFISRYFLSKKFQGLGVLFDCDVAQGFIYKTILVVKIKILFFGFWMSVDWKKINPSIKVELNVSDIKIAVERATTQNQNRK